MYHWSMPSLSTYWPFLRPELHHQRVGTQKVVIAGLPRNLQSRRGKQSSEGMSSLRAWPAISDHWYKRSIFKSLNHRSQPMRRNNYLFWYVLSSNRNKCILYQVVKVVIPRHILHLVPQYSYFVPRNSYLVARNSCLVAQYNKVILAATIYLPVRPIYVPLWRRLSSLIESLLWISFLTLRPSRLFRTYQ